MESSAYALPLSDVMDLLVDAVCVVDVAGRFVFVSAASERIFGYRPDELIGRNMIELVHPDDRSRTLRQAEHVMAGEPPPNFENRYLRKDGRVAHIMWSAHWSAERGVRVAVARDITARKHAETLQAALYAISEAAHAAADLATLFGQVHRIVAGLLPAQNFFVALRERERDLLHFPFFVDTREPPPASRPLDGGPLDEDVIRGGKAVLLQSGDADRHPPLAGSRRPHAWLGVPLATPDGVMGALVVQSYSSETGYRPEDVQLLQFVSTQVAAAIERKQVDARLHHMALHDPLTDLPNRALFRDRLQQAMLRARRGPEQVALLYVDLDRFKQVNDRHGHATGDALLVEAARRMQHCLRESDTVGRLGGDEFAILLHQVMPPSHVFELAEKICLALSRPFLLGDLSLELAASIGIAPCLGQTETPETLLDQADKAMYVAKQRGGNQWHNALDIHRTMPGQPAQA